MGKHGLTDQQRRFADGVLEGKNQKQAYIEAGYKARGHSAETKASRLVRNGKVEAYLAEHREELREEVEITARAVAEAFAEIAFMDPRCLVEWGPDGVEVRDSRTLSPEQARLASRIKIKRKITRNEKGDEYETVDIDLRTYDRLRALENLGKILGVYQADAQNWQDRRADLIKDLFWDWVISHHLHTGRAVAELVTYGKNHPEEVQEWGHEQGLLPAGDASP